MHSQGPVYEVLNRFTGTWSTTGKIYSNPFIPEGKLSGTDIYKWLDGGFFLIHHADVMIGENKVKSIEIIGYDYSSNSYLMNSFDNQGNHVIMHAEYNRGIWMFTGGAMRFTGSFAKDWKSLNGVWEYHENKAWKKWMDITLKKSG